MVSEPVVLLSLDELDYRKALRRAEQTSKTFVIVAETLTVRQAIKAVEVLSAIGRTNRRAVLLLKTVSEEMVERLFRITSTDLWLWDLVLEDEEKWVEVLKKWLSDPLHLSAPARLLVEYLPDPFPSVADAFSKAVKKVLPAEPEPNRYPNPHYLARRTDEKYSVFARRVFDTSGLRGGRIRFPVTPEPHRGLESGRACVVAEASRTCPLNCPYCFRKAAYRTRPELQQGVPKYISAAVVEAILYALLERGGEKASVNFLFHGAEPLTMPYAVVRQVASTLAWFKKQGMDLDYGIQTGYGMDKGKIAEFLKAFVEAGLPPVLPSTSWDPLRPTRLSEIFDKAAFAAEVVNKRFWGISAIMVYDGSWSMGENFKKFARRASQFMSIQTNVLSVVDRPQEERAEQWAETLFDLFREGIDVKPAGYLITKLVLGCMVHDCFSERSSKGYLIGVGTDGKTGGCDMWTGWRLPQLCWGNVYEFDEMLTSPARVWNTTYAPPECIECKYYPLCGGGCALRRAAFEAKPYTDKWCESVMHKDAKLTFCNYYSAFIKRIYGWTLNRWPFETL